MNILNFKHENHNFTGRILRFWRTAILGFGILSKDYILATKDSNEKWIALDERPTTNLLRNDLFSASPRNPYIGNTLHVTELAAITGMMTVWITTILPVR